MSGTAPADVPTARGVRGWVWTQLVIGWLPVWALYALLILAAHGGPVWPALLNAALAILAAAVLGVPVKRLTDWLPWPRPIRLSFVGIHTAAAVVYSLAWFALASLMQSVLRWHLIVVAPAGSGPFLVLGLWLYIAVVGVFYAVRATERAARAEAAAVESQLAALRSQLNPHFLFNALHTVVQLIPIEPTRAAQAAEQLAGLLRTAIEEDRDLVPLREECAFVQRYLELERIRFEERLQVEFTVGPEAAGLLVPSFVLQTLVENAVRHGAAPRVEPTRISIGARVEGESLVVTVADTGAGSATGAIGRGTGLRRLRERLDGLFGDRAALALVTAERAGFTATVRLPRSSAESD